MRDPIDLHLAVYSVYTKLAKHASYFAYNFSLQLKQYLDTLTHIWVLAHKMQT